MDLTDKTDDQQYDLDDVPMLEDISASRYDRKATRDVRAVLRLNKLALEEIRQQTMRGVAARQLLHAYQAVDIAVNLLTTYLALNGVTDDQEDSDEEK